MNFASVPISTLIFIVTIGFSLMGLYVNNHIIGKFSLQPYSFIYYKKWYQIFTSGFLHADLFHLAFNMLSFYYFAFPLEEAMGSADFLGLYVASLVFSSVTTIIKQKDNYAYRCLGASGAISAVIFGYILFFPTAKLAIFPIPFGIPAPVFAVLYLFYCYYAGKHSHDMINHEAHFWGALSGIILTIVLKPESLDSFISYFSK